MTSVTTRPGSGSAHPITIYVDADACPVKEEVYKVALRHSVPVIIVSNSPFRIPDHALVSRVVVNDSFDAADDWIADRASAEAIVITADILLAERCVKADAAVLAHNGRPFTKDSIGSAIATRAIMADLRSGMGAGDGALGPNGGGPPPFTKQDRSAFLQALDQILVKMKRQAALKSPPPR